MTKGTLALKRFPRSTGKRDATPLLDGTIQLALPTRRVALSTGGANKREHERVRVYDASLSRDPTSIKIPKIVRDYAPFVYLYPNDQHRPMGALEFIRGSKLMFAHDGGAGDEHVKFKKDEKEIDPGKLGLGSYKCRRKNGIFGHTGRPYRSNELTAPHRNNWPGEEAEGFFLEPRKSIRKGEGVNAPVYYYFKPGHYIVYWFFYAYNKAPTPKPKPEVEIRSPSLGTIIRNIKLNHEGDWENIAIKLRGSTPTRIAYYAHGGPKRMRWWDRRVQKKGTHPIVFSAKGSHASYWKEGKHRVPLPSKYAPFADVYDRTAKGDGRTQWLTWKYLKNVELEPWYGYGGAWGEVGHKAETTGPLGPDPRWKLGVPKGW